MPADFKQKKRGGKDGHDRQRDQGLFDLESHLIREIFRVGESGVVENKLIGKRCTDEIDYQAKKPVAKYQRAAQEYVLRGKRCTM